MGTQSRGFFDEANRVGGLVAKLRLAQLAQVTSTEAATVEDTPAIVERLKNAMDRVRAEFYKQPSSRSSTGIVAARTGSDEARLLRHQLQCYLDLMTQRALFLGDVQTTIRRINEAAATTLRIERVSVWFLGPQRDKIRCEDLFERSPARHTSGTELFAQDYAPYFKALQSERTIAAHDAHKDPRTSCFSESYLKPLGISSMLDVPIWSADKMVGVICHEHVGVGRTWNSDEETFAYLMSNFVALALERRPNTR